MMKQPFHGGNIHNNAGPILGLSGKGTADIVGGAFDAGLQELISRLSRPEGGAFVCFRREPTIAVQVKSNPAHWLFLVLLLAGAAQSWAETSFRLNVGSPATDPAMQGLQIVIHSVTKTDQSLQIRLGVFNTADKPVTGDATLSDEDVILVSYANGTRLETLPASNTLRALCPDGTLASKAVNNGLATFAWPPPSGTVDPAATLTLRIAHFAPVSFSLDADSTFTPIDYAATEKRSPLNVDISAQAEGLAIFVMRLNSLVIKDNVLEVVLAFQNSSRFPVTWKGQINGTMSRLITGEGDVLQPASVSDSLASRIAPAGKVWTAGEDNFGWIRFALPDPQAAEELMFVFPGYPPVRCTYSREQHTWQPAARAKAADAPSTKVEAVLEEERNYAALKSFWADATRELAMGHFQSFLSRFTGNARRDQRASIASWSKLPVTSVELSVPEFQRVRPDAKGRVTDVHVQMHYTLATLPRDNVFVSNMECDLLHDGDGSWTVEDIRYPNLQPFWMLGYTGVSQTEHFTIFHRDVSDAVQEVTAAARQLEKSYARLVRAGLPMMPHNAAFLVASKPDFEKMTDRNADNYSGVASAAYQYRDGRLSVINRAMYINDYRFFSLQRAWGKQDRQVVIQHEMVHLALAGQTRPWTPSWLAEGVAMHYAGQTDSFSREALRRALTPDIVVAGLSQIQRLGADTDDATKIMTEYQFAGEAVLLLIKKYGEAAVMKLYDAYAAEIPADLPALLGGGAAAKAARLRYTRKVFARSFGDLTLEQLDGLVRSVVNG